MVTRILEKERLIDFSFIPSLQCNLNCSFCMYDCGPLNSEKLNFTKTAGFVATIDWDIINSVGFYGGEISINTDLYQDFINLVPDYKDKWCISNGSWSINVYQMTPFLEFLIKNEFFLVISGTPEHKAHQNENILQLIKKNYPDAIKLKSDDNVIPMGRASKPEWSCTNKCQSHTNPVRLGLFPNGDILFQNCDGVYPIVQTYEQSFEGILDRVKEVSCLMKKKNKMSTKESVKNG